MRYYGGIKGALSSAVGVWRNYPEATIRIRCTCGWSQSFDNVMQARRFLMMHCAHISEWSIDLVDIHGIILWRMKVSLVRE